MGEAQTIDKYNNAIYTSYKQRIRSLYGVKKIFGICNRYCGAYAGFFLYRM